MIIEKKINVNNNFENGVIKLKEFGEKRYHLIVESLDRDAIMSELKNVFIDFQ